MKTVSNVLFCLMICFGCALSAIAQTQNDKPKLFNKFEFIGVEHAQAIMDVFIQELNEKPTSTAYIIVYGAKSDCLFIVNSKTKQPENKSVLPLKGLAQRRLKFCRDYLINNRGFDKSRLVLIDGGYKEKPSTEFWLVSAGQEPPKPAPTFEEKDVKFRKGKIKKSDVLKDC
jgi:hypothetical protein